MADRDPSTFLNSSSQARADQGPTPPEAPKVKAPAAATPTSSAGSGALPPESHPSAAEGATPASTAADGPSSTYTVTEGENGAHDIFNHTDDGPQKLGTSAWGKDDIGKIMGSAGAVYDKDHGVYSNVPENVAKVLAEGPQSLASEVKHRLNAGMIEFHRASLGVELAHGNLTAEDLRQRTHPDLVQLQLDRHPAQAWKGLGDAVSKFMEHPVDEGEDLMKRSITATAEALPSLADLAGKATLGTAIGGTAAAFFGPEAIPVGMHVGGAVGTFLSLYNQELGSRMAGLADRGLNDKDIHTHAPAEAVKSAIGAGIYMYGVEAMAAPFKARFLQSLGDKAAEPVKALTEKMASWAYNYGVNAGIKMPAVGIVHQMTSDLMDNMSALVEKRPDLMKSPMDFSNNAIEAAAGMAKLGVVAGVPGLAFEAGLGALDHAAETKAAGEMTERLKGVERREPLTSETPAPSSPSGSPSGEKTPGPSEQTASSGPSQEKPLAPLESPSQPSVDLKSPLPDSITEHPAYVKAVEDAKEDLREAGVKPTDREGVIDAYDKAAQAAHDYNNEAMAKLLKVDPETGDKSVVELTPDEENQVSAQIDHLVGKMRNLRQLALFARDPDVKAAYEDWVANGQEGERPPLPVDPHNERSTARSAAAGPGAAPSTLPAVGPSDAELEKSMNETLANKDAKPGEVVQATSAAAERLDEKAQEATVKARAEAVKTEHEALKQRIGEIASTRDRMQKNGLSTRAIDRQLNGLLDKAVGLQKEGELLARRDPNELEVSPKAKLQMKPATLQNIMEAGFKEGGKQSQERARELLKIAEDNGLTANDVKKLIGNKSIGAMGDTAYKNFLDGFDREVEGKEPVRTPGFKEGVEKLVERKKARAEVASVLQEKQLEREPLIRKLHGLPAFSKMTTEQLKSYADILRDYDKGDRALSPDRIEALKGTKLEGVKTEGEARERAVKITGLPVEDFKNLKLGHTPRALPEPNARYWHPALGMVFDHTGELMEKGARLGDVVNNRHLELAAKAIRERRAASGLGGRLADWFAPQQREVFAYLSAKDPAEVAARAEQLTPAELEWAGFLKQFFNVANATLERKGMVSRFVDAYAPHTAKALPEIIRDATRVGLWGTLKEMIPPEWRTESEVINRGNDVLGFEKEMKQTRYRTGALDPSKNLVKAVSAYIHDYYAKMAADQASPYIQTLTESMESRDPEQKFGTSLASFTKEFLNNKKNINHSAGGFGDFVAPVLRFGQAAASIHYLAANYALQAVKMGVAVPLGKFMAIDSPVDFVRTTGLRFTEQGKTFLKGVEHVTGKDFLGGLKEPGQDAADYTNKALFGGFQVAHQRAVGDVLLAAATPEELAAGKMSDARVTEVLQKAGRWLNFTGQSSVYMDNPLGRAGTQFKNWYLPPTLTLAEDAHALYKTVTTLGAEKMTPEQMRDILKIGTLAAGAAASSSILTKDMEDDTFKGQVIHYLRHSMGSMWRGLKADAWTTVAATAYLGKIAADLTLLGSLEEYKNDSATHSAGDSKGWAALKRDVTPKMFKDFEKAYQQVHGDE